MANTIAKMRADTWNGVLPGDNNGFESVPYDRKNTGTEPFYPETSKAGIKVSELDQLSPIARKAARARAAANGTPIGPNDAPDYENTNYPKEAVTAAPTNPGNGSGSGAGDGDTSSGTGDE
jgi:hypothetical protein